MRPVLHAPTCGLYSEPKTVCTCGATFREIMRRHEEWLAAHPERAPKS